MDHGREPIDSSECSSDLCERDEHSGEILLCTKHYQDIMPTHVTDIKNYDDRGCLEARPPEAPLISSTYIFNIIGDVELKHDYDEYLKMEDEMSTILRDMRYTLHGNWWTSEGDSFGPLMRSIKATTPDNRRIEIYYG